MKKLIAAVSLLLFVGLTGCIGGKTIIRDEELEKAYENIDIEDKVKGTWINIHNPSEVLFLGDNQEFELREVCWAENRSPNSGFNRPQIRTILGSWELNGNHTLVLKNIITIDSSRDIPTAGYLELRGSIEKDKKGNLRIVALRKLLKHPVIFNGEIWIRDK